MSSEHLITVTDAAAALGCDPVTIRRHIASGQLRAVRIGGRWMIARATIDVLLALAGVPQDMSAAPCPTMNAGAGKGRR